MWSFSTLSHRQPAMKASIKFINLYTKIYSLLNRKHTLPLAISLCAGSSADKKYVFPPPDDSSSLKGFKLLSQKFIFKESLWWKIPAQISYICGNSGNGNFWATVSDFPCEKSVSNASLFFFNYYKIDKCTRTKAWTGKHHIGLEDENRRIVRLKKCSSIWLRCGEDI